MENSGYTTGSETINGDVPRQLSSLPNGQSTSKPRRSHGHHRTHPKTKPESGNLKPKSSPAEKSPQDATAVTLKEEITDSDFEDDEYGTPNAFMRGVETVQKGLADAYSSQESRFKMLIYGIVLIGFHVYLGFAIAYDFHKALALLVLTVIVWVGVIYFVVIKKTIGPSIYEKGLVPLSNSISKATSHPAVTWIIWLIILGGIAGFLAYDTRNDRSRLTSLLGLVIFFIFLFVFSMNPSKVRWRPVMWGLLGQFLMGLLVLRWPVGSAAFNWAAEQIVTFLDYTVAGTQFVFGFLAVPPPICGMSGVFAFTVLQVIIYFGSIVAVLYYLGIMQFILTRMAWLMQLTLQTTAAESLDGVACIFLGMTEAPIMIRPYLSRMTMSEMHAIMTVGYACVAGSLFAAYISFGACATYILSATVMNAPAALAISKLFCPETKVSKLKRIEDLELPKGTENNVIECISNGAVNTIHLVWAICANLVVFLALLAFADSTIQWIAAMLGYQHFTFDNLMGYLFYPVAWIMGSGSESMVVAELMGKKTVLNEFIAYQQLGKYVIQGKISARAQMIATYALCGFANISSIGIQMGTLGGMCPERKSVLSKIAVRALIAGMITNFSTACIAGVLVETPTTCAHKAAAACFNVTAHLPASNVSTLMSLMH